MDGTIIPNIRTERTETTETHQQKRPWTEPTYQTYKQNESKSTQPTNGTNTPNLATRQTHTIYERHQHVRFSETFYAQSLSLDTHYDIYELDQPCVQISSSAHIPLAVLVYPVLQNGAEQETVGIAVGDTSLQTNGRSFWDPRSSGPG